GGAAARDAGDSREYVPVALYRDARSGAEPAHAPAALSRAGLRCPRSTRPRAGLVFPQSLLELSVAATADPACIPADVGRIPVVVPVAAVRLAYELDRLVAAGRHLDGLGPDHDEPV